MKTLSRSSKYRYIATTWPTDPVERRQHLQSQWCNKYFLENDEVDKDFRPKTAGPSA